MYLNIKKAICDKHTASIILSGKKLKTFSLRSGTRQECLVSPLLFNKELQALVRTFMQEREVKAIQTGKKEAKWSLFADDMILHSPSSNC